MTQSHEQHSPGPSLATDTLLQDRYRIVRQLGRGGMGAVYEAIDERLGIIVALKETFSTEASTRKQFEHEARLLAGMQHPALPRVSDHFVEGDRAFLVMQFIGGIDLAKIIAQQPGPFPQDQVIAWADQLLDALIYLHSRDRQVIHRDIKPHNLKLTSTGQIALLDFGLAKAQPADTSVTASRAFFGYTKHYAPLEQIRDERTDARSDIYALGATLYHLLTGIKPPDALVRASALINSETDPLRPADKVNSAVGPEIAAILRKAMAQKSEQRYATAIEFREALRQVGRKTMQRKTPPVIEDAELAPTNVLRPQPEVNMAIVESARRLGPGAVTAMLVAVVVFAVAVFYSSPQWLAAAEPATKAAPDRMERESNTLRKPERARTITNSLILPAKAKAPAETEKATEPKKPARAASRETQPQPTRKPTPSKRRLSVPSIRMPEPEIADSAAALTRNRVDSSAAGGPRFLRESDGTYIVKFADGTTRVVKPGQRSAE